QHGAEERHGGAEHCRERCAEPELRPGNESEGKGGVREPDEEERSQVWPDHRPPPHGAQAEPEDQRRERNSPAHKRQRPELRNPDPDEEVRAAPEGAHHQKGGQIDRLHETASVASEKVVGWSDERYRPGTRRAAIESRFQALITAIANVRSASSVREKCGSTAAWTLSGTWSSATRVTASAHSSAARSLAV